MIIQHNLMAQNAARQLQGTTNSQKKSVERLSSGYRINRAADDAAGLAISEKMRSMIRGLDRASANAQDGISLLQTAEGALSEVHSIIQRIRELSVQGANDTNTFEDRDDIQDEIDELVDEIDWIADNTEFNTMSLLDGSLESDKTRRGTAASADPGVGIATVVHTDILRPADTFPIIIDPIPGAGVDPTSLSYTKLETELKTVLVPQAVNSLMATLPAFADAVAAGKVSSTIGLTIENTLNSYAAYVAINYSYNPVTLEPGSISLSLCVNTHHLYFAGDGTLTPASRSQLEATIVHEMTHAFMDDVDSAGMVGVSAGKMDSKNRLPKWFIEGMAQVTSGGMDWVGALHINKDSSISAISSSLRNPDNKIGSDTTASQYATGYLATMYLGWMAAGSSATIDRDNLRNGINIIMEKLVGGQSLSEIINEISGGKYISASDFERKFGDAASAAFVKDFLTAATGGAGALALPSLTDTDLLPDTATTAPVYRLDSDHEFVLSDVADRSWTGGGRGDDPIEPDIISDGPLILQVGAMEGQTVAISIEDSHASAIGLTKLSVASNALAGETISACDTALGNVSKIRSKLGAYVNRLEHAIANLDTTSENTQAAESALRDADMAWEIMLNSKYNILMQAGQSMLAQTNQMTSSVLSLLQ